MLLHRLSCAGMLARSFPMLALIVLIAMVMMLLLIIMMVMLMPLLFLAKK
jgi:hypothetical protein